VINKAQIADTATPDHWFAVGIRLLMLRMENIIKTKVKN
jgi:hypothetical protein